MKRPLTKWNPCRSMVPMYLIAVMAALLTGILPANVAAEEAVVQAETQLDLAQYSGQVVYLDFWASWCKPCRNSMPWLNSMQEKYGEQGLVVIGVNVDRKSSAVDKFLEEVPVSFTIIRDPEGILPKQYQLKAMPTSFVYDRQGNLVTSTIGFQAQEAEAMEARIRELLQQQHQGGSPAQDIISASEK